MECKSNELRMPMCMGGITTLRFEGMVRTQTVGGFFLPSKQTKGNLGQKALGSKYSIQPLCSLIRANRECEKGEVHFLPSALFSDGELAGVTRKSTNAARPP